MPSLGEVDGPEGGLPAVLAHLDEMAPDEMAQRRYVHRVIRACIGYSVQVREEYRRALTGKTGDGRAYIGVGEWRTAEKEARDERQRQARANAKPDERYQAKDGMLYMADPVAGLLLLARFVPAVVADVTRDDGAERTQMMRVRVTLPSGRTGEADITPERMTKAREWAVRAVGADAVIMPQSRAEEHVLTAAQIFGQEVKEHRTEYGHTGWRLIGGVWRFLTASGALGSDGLDPSCPVVLGERLSAYRLPDPVAVPADELRAAVRASLDLRHLGPLPVMVAQLGAAYRAPLPLLPDTSVFVAGGSGSLKTAVSAVVCQHFGAGLTAKALPAEWKATANALEATAHALSGVLLVVDDYAPQAADDPRRLAAAADRVLRGAANTSGRDRLRPDGTLRPAKPPRAQILSTGEDIPPGHSLRARLTITEVDQDTYDRARLTDAQQQGGGGVYALAMAGYIRHLASERDRLPDVLRGAMVATRAGLAVDGQHLRAPEAAASLYLGWKEWLRYAQVIGAVSVQEADTLLSQVHHGVLDLVATQASYTRDASPARQYVTALDAAIVGGGAHLADQTTGGEPKPGKPAAYGWQIGPGGDTQGDWRPRGTCIGWVSEDGQVYLDPGAAYEVARTHIARAGGQLGTSDRTIRKRLHEAGMLASIEGPGHLTVRQATPSSRRRVLHLRRGLLALATESDSQ